MLLDGLTTKSLYDGLAETLANNERTFKMVKDTHVILPPTAMSTPVGPRRFYLLIVALIGSILLSVEQSCCSTGLRLFVNTSYRNAIRLEVLISGRH